jgi:hypothetical protein
MIAEQIERALKLGYSIEIESNFNMCRISLQDKHSKINFEQSVPRDYIDSEIENVIKFCIDKLNDKHV